MVVWPLTDHPEGIFAPGVVLLPGTGGRDPDPEAAPLVVETSRPFQRGFLVRFAGVEDRNGAEALRGVYLMRALADLEPLAEGEVFYHQLLGMSVATVDGRSLGTVREVYELEPADLLEVRGAGGTILVPFLATVVVDVDLGQRRMVIDPPDGFLDL